jgi:molybdopterin biosynthesis enzyme
MKRVASFDESTMDSIASDRSDTDPSWHPPASVTVPDFLTRINAPLPNSAAAQIRYGISDEGMAKTCQALQADM